MRIVFILIVFIFQSCGISSSSDYRDAGQEKIKKFITELKKVHSRDQLLDSEKNLVLCYKDLIDLFVLAKDYLEKKGGSDEPLLLSSKDHELNEDLRFEMIRICRIEGGREVLEKYQNIALEECKKARLN